MLHAWKTAGHVDNEQWHYAVARSSSRPLGVVVKSARTSLFADWTGLLAMWLSLGVLVGGLRGWVAFRRVTRQLSFPATLQWAISVAEENDLIQPLTNLVLDRTIAELSKLLRSRPAFYVQVEYLVQRGVQFGQGWFFAKAMRAVELSAWLDERAMTAQPVSPEHRSIEQ